MDKDTVMDLVKDIELSNIDDMTDQQFVDYTRGKIEEIEYELRIMESSIDYPY